MASLIVPPLPQTLQTAILRPSSLVFPKSHPPRSSPVIYRSPTSTNPEISLAVGSGRRRLTRLLAMSSSTSEFVPNIGDILGNVTIFKASGEPILFENLWDQNQGVAVVALLRHFGCPCCWELASVLKESKPKFDATGAKLVAVGVGTPDKARILADRLPFPVDCLYADPDRKAYEVLGLYYGFGRTFFNPASAKVFSRFESLRKAVKNYTFKATPDDKSSVLQQGGIFVFKGKQLLYARKDEGTGDHAPLDDIFNACCKVPVA